MWELIKNFDAGLFHLINQGGKNALFDAVMPVISDIRYFLLPAVVFWFMLILKKDVKKRTVAVMILLAITTSDLVSAHVLKPFFQRQRPFHSLSEIHYYRGGEWRLTPGKMEASTSTNFSLPSSHATNMFAAAVFLSWFFRGFAWLYFLMAVLVCYSRVYLGMHYPLDLVAGGVFGTAIGIFYILLAEGVIRLIRDKKEPDNTEPS